MKKQLDPQKINLKANSILLISYLETAIGDEMILNSFIRDIKIIEENNKEIIIATSSKKAIEIIKQNYNIQFLQGIENIYQKKLDLKLIINGEEKIFLETLKDKKNEGINVSQKFNFDNYVVSSFNKEATIIGKKISQKPGKFSPLYIYGSSGLGKTHLLHAIGNDFTKRNLSTYYIEPNKFTSTITNYAKEGGNKISNYIESFKKYDAILFDDIQNLGDRSVTLKVLFNIINNHISNEKQIVIASDKTAQELSGFQPRFITRFVSGISTKINQPELDDLIKILKDKLNIEKLDPEKWEKEALKFIARNNSNSIRSLEGAIKRIIFFTENESNIKYTYEIISNIFKELAIDPAELTPNRIINTVANYYKINKKDMIGKSRKRDFVLARHMAIYLIKKINKISYVEIGNIFGNRDHSTIISAITKIRNNIKINNITKKALDEIEQKIKSIN